MKNIFLFKVLLYSILCQSQIVDIPDNNFKNKLVNTNCVDSNNDGTYDTDVDTNNDGEIQQSEALAISGTLRVSYSNITNLKGIEAFINLTKLFCNSNQLTSLNVTKLVNLNELNCNFNPLTSLDVTKNINLIKLQCGLTKTLSTIDVTKNINLTLLHLFSNALTNIDLSKNINLVHLSLGYNPITNIDVSNNTLLKYIDCIENEFTAIDLSKNELLTSIFIQNNPNLIDVNLKNGNNHNVPKGVNFIDFGNLPSLETVCVDDKNSVFIDNLIEYHPELSTVNFTDQCTLALNENQLQKFTIYQNSIEDKLIINSNSDIQNITVYNNLGQIVLQKRDLNIINTTNLKRGVYFIKIEDVKHYKGVIKFLKN